MTAPFAPTWRRVSQQLLVGGGYMVLNLLLQLQTRRQLTLAMKRQIWHG